MSSKLDFYHNKLTWLSFLGDSLRHNVKLLNARCQRFYMRNPVHFSHSKKIGSFDN